MESQTKNIHIDTWKQIKLHFNIVILDDKDDSKPLSGEHVGKGVKNDNMKVVSKTDDALQSHVDSILKLLDKDNDGFITYSEYKLSNAKFRN